MRVKQLLALPLQGGYCPPDHPEKRLWRRALEARFGWSGGQYAIAPSEREGKKLLKARSKR
eukprot:11220895-Alexandrium_andersonii.AAC.1